MGIWLIGGVRIMGYFDDCYIIFFDFLYIFQIWSFYEGVNVCIVG